MTLRDEFEHDGVVYQLIEQTAVFGAPAIIRSMVRDEHSGNEVAGIRDFDSLPLARVAWAELVAQCRGQPVASLADSPRCLDFVSGSFERCPNHTDAERFGFCAEHSKLPASALDAIGTAVETRRALMCDAYWRGCAAGDAKNFAASFAAFDEAHNHYVAAQQLLADGWKARKGHADA